jgi:hypothetical protein
MAVYSYATRKEAVAARHLHKQSGEMVSAVKKDKEEGLRKPFYFETGPFRRVKVNPSPQIAFKLIAGRKFQFEDGRRGQEFKWTDLRDKSHGSFDLTMDKKAYNVKGDTPPQVLLKGAFESMTVRSANPSRRYTVSKTSSGYVVKSPGFMVRRYPFSTRKEAVAFADSSNTALGPDPGPKEQVKLRGTLSRFRHH